jgi:hypothetical protein
MVGGYGPSAMKMIISSNGFVLSALLQVLCHMCDVTAFWLPSATRIFKLCYE